MENALVYILSSACALRPVDCQIVAFLTRLSIFSHHDGANKEITREFLHANGVESCEYLIFLRLLSYLDRFISI